MPISAAHVDYCQRVTEELKRAGWLVELDSSDASLNKKIRQAQLMQCNYIVVAGDAEVAE